MKKIICNFCYNEVKEKQLFTKRNTGDSLNVVLDSFDDWKDGKSDFDVCKKCIKKIGKRFFNKMADKYCSMNPEDEFIREVWDKKVRSMARELRNKVSQKTRGTKQ